MFQLLILALVFAGTAGLLYGGYVFMNRRTLAASDAALARLQEGDLAAVQAARSILRDESVSEVPFLDRMLAGRNTTERITERLRRASAGYSAGNFILRTAVSALIGFLLLSWILGGLVAGLIGFVIGALVPWVWVNRGISRRSKRFRDQLPDALDMLVSAMKAGYSFQAAMKFIGEELGAPLGPEFLRFYEEQRLGVEVRTALLALQARVDDLDLKMFVTAVLIQRETGGNLSEILDRIASLMRERSALLGEVETLTAESKLSARIIGVLPFVVFGAISVINPEFMRPIRETSYGPWLLAGCVASVLLGWTIVMRMAEIDI